MTRLVQCSKSQWHRFHPEGEACPECEPEQISASVELPTLKHAGEWIQQNGGSSDPGLSAWLPDGWSIDHAKCTFKCACGQEYTHVFAEAIGDVIRCDACGGSAVTDVQMHCS